VDISVEFDAGFRPGMLSLHELEQQLSAVFGGRKIDMVNPKYINRRIWDRVLGEAEVQFAER
jgi:predicted nucleotidyltransferase